MYFKIPDRYRPTGKRMSGGFGDVLVCKDTNLDRLVAVKFARNIKDLSRLLDEIAALQRIRSKHVVEVYDLIFGKGEDEVAIITEFLPGRDLLAISGKIEQGAYLKILYQIASGIGDIHEQGEIHRDIKPNNMKYDDEGFIKIFDFGLTKPEDEAITIGNVGTPGFAAPELFAPPPVTFTKAVDTYAFGATALFAWFGTLPDNLLEAPPQPDEKPFASLPFGLPNDVLSVLDRTLSVRPIDRPSMNEVKDIIGRRLVFGRHQALAVSGGTVYEINRNKNQKGININAGTMV